MGTIAVASRRSIFLGHASQARDFLPLLRWLVLTSLTVFAVLALWQLSIIQTMSFPKRCCAWRSRCLGYWFRMEQAGMGSSTE